MCFARVVVGCDDAAAGDVEAIDNYEAARADDVGVDVEGYRSLGVQGQFRVVDIAPAMDNAWGDAYVIVRVVLANSQFFGAVTAIA